MDAIDGKIYHRAKLISEDGVSALCFRRPRAVKVREGNESWTLRDEAVTCPKCLALIAAGTAGPGEGR